MLKRSDYPAEIALQLSTMGGGPEDRVESAKTRLARLFISRAVEQVTPHPRWPLIETHQWTPNQRLQRLDVDEDRQQDQ